MVSDDACLWVALNTLLFLLGLWCDTSELCPPPTKILLVSDGEGEEVHIRCLVQSDYFLYQCC